MMALQNFGVELLPVIAGLGVAGAELALATQGVLSNAVAGPTIIFTKPYRVGEYVAIVGEILHNYGRIRRTEVRIGIAYDEDLATALAVVGELAESAAWLTVKPWVAVQDFSLVESDLAVAMLDALARRGIRLAVPQRDVRLIQE